MHLLIFFEVCMKYCDRKTSRNKIDDNYIYSSKSDRSTLTTTLGMYEDFRLSPSELAETLISYEMTKPAQDWDMDKLELWSSIMRRSSATEIAEQ